MRKRFRSGPSQLGFGNDTDSKSTCNEDQEPPQFSGIAQANDPRSSIKKISHAPPGASDCKHTGPESAQCCGENQNRIKSQKGRGSQYFGKPPAHQGACADQEQSDDVRLRSLQPIGRCHLFDQSFCLTNHVRALWRIYLLFSAPPMRHSRNPEWVFVRIESQPGIVYFFSVRRSFAGRCEEHSLPAELRAALGEQEGV